MKIEKVKEVYKGDFVSLKIIEGKLKGQNIKREIVVFSNTVSVLPLIEKDKIILIKQYRAPVEKELWEIPAGKLDKGEDPEKGAKRELEEETGFKAGKLEQIAEFYKSPGYCTEYMYVFRATFLEKTKQRLDDGEIIEQVKVFSLSEALKMIENKEIIDAHTIIALIYEKDRRKHE